MALYQGHPTVLEGNIIKQVWWRYWHPRGMEMPLVEVRDMKGHTTYIPSEPLPDIFDEALQSWDCSFKDSTTSDFVVGTVWCRRSASCYLTDMCRKRMDFVETKNAIREMRRKHIMGDSILIEDKANGTSIISDLKREVQGIIPIDPKESKDSRVYSITSMLEGGHVYLPHPDLPGFSWVQEIINECNAYPTGTHDDIVDSITQALIRLKYSTKRANVSLQVGDGFVTENELNDMGFGTYSRTARRPQGRFHRSRVI